MSVVQRIAKLAQNGAISKGVQKYLTDVGPDLERLATKAAKGLGELNPNEVSQFRKIYADYLREALNANRSARDLSAFDKVKLEAEIRDDFFNKVLGGAGRTDEERLALRATLLRGPKGEGIKIADGRTVTREQYASLQTQNNIGMISGTDKILLEEIQAAERRLDTAAMSRATAQHHSDTATLRAKADAATAARDAQKKAAQEAEERAKRADEAAKKAAQDAATRGNALDDIDNAIRSGDPTKIETAFASFRKLNGTGKPFIVDTTRNNPLSPDEVLYYARNGQDITRQELLNTEHAFIDEALQIAVKQKANEARVSISDAGEKLIRAYRNNNPLDVNEFFKNLVTLMRQKGVEQIVDTLEDAGRDFPITSYQNIALAIKNGQKVTKKELEDLILFIDRKADATRIADATSINQPTPVMGTTGWTAAVKAIESAQNVLKKALPPAEKSQTRNNLEQWVSETRSAPGFWGRLGNNVLDRPFVFGVPLATLTSAVSIAVHFNTFSDLSLGGDFGRIKTYLAELSILEEKEIKDVQGYNDVVGRLYARMAKNVKGITPDSTFERLTHKITGQGFFTDAEREEHTGVISFFTDMFRNLPSRNPVDFSSAEKVEAVRKLIEKTSSAVPGASGNFTDDELTAYKVYLSKIVHAAPVGAGGEGESWKPTSDISEIAKSWADKTARQMWQDPELAKGIIKKYYGEENPSDESMRRNLHAAKEQGKLKDSSGKPISDSYFQAMARFLVLTGRVDNLNTALDPKLIQNYVKDNATSSIERQVREADVAIGAQFFGRGEPAHPTKSDAETVRKRFNQVANDEEAYPELKGKVSILMGAFDASRTGEDFQKKLEAAHIPKETIAPLREFAYGQSQ